MFDQMAKLVAYGKAPATTFQVLHPVEAMRLRLLPFEVRHGYGVRLALIAGALVAFPLGMVVGLRRGRSPRRSPLREKLERQREARHGREPVHPLPHARGAGATVESAFRGEGSPTGV
jgi:hypothetical protein